MKHWYKPTIFISNCLLNYPCRYDGKSAEDKLIHKLKPYVNITNACPEEAIGLPTPREAIRLVKAQENTRLIQPSTNLDLTNAMVEFSEELFNKLPEMDGFILKGKSPSCGLKEVKIYNSKEKGASIAKGHGIFAAEVMDRYSRIPIEDEGRLKNFTIREHFFNRIFTLAHFRGVKAQKDVDSLKDFHNKNNFLFMVYNKKELKELEKIMSTADRIPIEILLLQYENQLLKVMAKTPRYTSNINLLLQCLEYFNHGLKEEEKAFTMELIDKYRLGKVPLSVPINIIKTHAIRFNEEYLLSQSFFQPYPEDLMDISDSGKGVNH